jgi:prepilin-type N-terminal cleavage/methylation domain-containing protein
MNKEFNSKKYDGFSLIEMLLTLAIIGFVMMISSMVLSTLIRVSIATSNKTRARNESEFVLELIRRTVRNSNPRDVHIFETSFAREYDFENDEVVDNPTYYISDVYIPKGEAEVGNEIHFRPYGYKDWICIGFFQSSEENNDTGYLLMTSNPNLLSQHENCFKEANHIIVLNSDYINVKDFEIIYTISSDMSYLISFDVRVEPMDWYLGRNAPITREVLRQGVVSTEGFMW